MPRVCITEAKRLENYIYHQLELAIALFGITQQEAGEAIGITQSGFSQAFNGRTLSVEQLCQLMERLGLKVCIESK